jgi:hypothetical protein
MPNYSVDAAGKELVGKAERIAREVAAPAAAKVDSDSRARV